MSPLGGDTSQTPEAANMLSIVEGLPDAFVVLDAERRIQFSNSAFIDLAQLATKAQAHGEPIDRWLGRPGVEIDVFFSNLQINRSIRHFSTVLRGEYGTTERVDVSAAEISANGRSHYGLSFRPSTWNTTGDRPSGRQLPRSVDQFTDLVGQVPLKNLVRETTDFIERLCIEVALEMSKDNKALAAEMLGLSRQGLYTKLHRYGLADPEEKDTDGPARS
jgi:transcriptional regulator PpsR